MDVIVNADLFSTFTVDIADEPRRDSRDWRNVPTSKRQRRQPRRQATRKDAVRAYQREGGY